MKAFLITFLLFIYNYQHCQGQLFSFSMYFEDNIGHKDTLTFGFDSEATDSIDIAFNEHNLKDKSFDEEFEVRSTNQYGLAFHGIPFLLKTQIEKNKCNFPVIPYVSAILVKCKNYPIKIKWDKNLFLNSCNEKSLITDWNPGGWFDAVEGGEQGPYFLKDRDSIILFYIGNNDYYIKDEEKVIDTVRLLYFAISSEQNYNMILGDNPYEINTSIVFYPNPVKDILRIKYYNTSDIMYIKIVDIYGKILVTSKSDHIDMSTLREGLYIIKVRLRNSSEEIISSIIKIK